ncbi:MAG: PqqD family protein [Janthinobacterium lividum]
MEDDTLVTQREALVEAEVDDELMGLSIDRGLCFGFNATATDLWRMIATPQTLETLCDRMIEGHEVDRATCAADLAVALHRMADQGLVTLTPRR